MIGVIGIPGDRQNEIGYAIGEICANTLDKIVIKEDRDKRGRKPGEIAELLKEAVLKVNKNANLMICLEEVEALNNAINISKPGDTIVVFYEKLEPLLEFVSKEKINEINTFENVKQYKVDVN